MRIGIVTQPLEMNYGGILQNWALQQVLKRLGHDPITIDAYERYTTAHYVYNWMRVWWHRQRGKKWKYPTRYHGATRSETTGRFIEQKIVKTQVMWDYKRSVVRSYGMDALIVGSDQVWRRAFCEDHLADMYLGFAAGLPVKRVAYAASFGVDEWDYTAEQTAHCGELARGFDAVSVREESGVDLCREHLGVEAQCVLDPTMLLCAEDYREIIDADNDASEPYLAVYCLDKTPAKEEFFNRLARERGLEVRYFTTGWKSKLTIEQWLATFGNASMVVTDSFHGTVFSILFGKEFYTLCNPNRGNARMLSLLGKLGLEERMVSDEVLAEPAKRDIDWDAVHGRLDGLRHESLDFLKMALSETHS